jgi:hypothetical protein
MTSACAGGDPLGCLNAARAAPRAGVSLPDQIRLYQRSCDGDVGDGCLGAARLLEAVAPGSAEIRALLRRGCLAGSAAACTRLSPGGQGI